MAEICEKIDHPFLSPMIKLLTSIFLAVCLSAQVQAYSPIYVHNLDDSGTDSLRDAILKANAQPGSTILFNLDYVPATISLTSPLPAISSRTTIDAYNVKVSNPDYDPAYNPNDPDTYPPGPNYWDMYIPVDPPVADSGPVISLDGASAGNNADGFVITAGASTLNSLIITGFAGSGVRLNSNNNVVKGCYIGTDDGYSNAGNGVAGIVITGTNNTIGGSTVAERNLIGCNPVNVLLSGTLAYKNFVRGNYIGVEADGAASLPSNFGETTSGVVVSSGSGNTIYGNVISGQSDAGVLLTGSARGNTVTGNLIGTDCIPDDPTLPMTIISASSAIPNQDGVRIEDGATNNTIGGDLISDRNLISGNNGNGVAVNSGSANIIRGNFIGLAGAGDALISNLGNGIDIRGPDGTSVIATSVTGNTISGNTVGIEIAENSTFTTVLANKIGTDSTGNTSLGNTGPGIEVLSSSNNQIGNRTLYSPSSAYCNVISGNTIGISIAGSVGDKIQGNAIGTDIDGTASIPNIGADVGTPDYNEGFGVYCSGSNQTIQGNVISGNSNHGIWLSDANSVTVSANFIGLDLSGSNALGNDGDGILITGGGSHVVGWLGTSGSAGGARNFISGNDSSGIEVSSTNVIIRSNYIGVSKAGNVGIPNGAVSTDGAGILLISGDYAASHIYIGGTSSSFGNVISSNNGDGVQLNGADVAYNFVLGNTIGFDSTKTSVLTNTGNGVAIYNGAHDNVIGDLGSATANYIVSANDGVLVSGTNSTENTIRGNSISLAPGSLGQAINLITDSADPNNLIPAPSLLTVNNLENLGLIGGAYHGAPNESCFVDLYKALTGSATANYVTSLSILTDGSGNATFSTQLGGNQGGYTLYAAVTDSSLATSEFSSGLPIPTRFRLSGTSVSVGEKAGSLAVVVGRDGDVSKPATITVSTQDGTAHGSGTVRDFQAISAPVTFPATVKTGTAFIPIFDNTRTDGDRSFTVALANPPANSVLIPDRMTVTINDDDAPAGVIGFASATFRADESSKKIPLTVQRSGGLTKSASVVYKITNGTAKAGTDFIASGTGTIRFAIGQKTVTTLAPTIVYHPILDKDRSFTVALSSPSAGAALANTSALPAIASATICDDSNSKGTLEFAAANLNVNENVGTAKLTINRLGGTSSAVSVKYSTRNGSALGGSDFTPVVTGTASFKAGVPTAVISIPILNNSLVEPTESFRVTLSSPALGATIGAQNTMDVTIFDDDTAAGAIQFSAATVSATELAGTAKLTLSRLGGSTGTVSVHYATADGSAVGNKDYQSTSGTVTFYPGQQTATIAVPIIKDTLHEAAETFSVNLSNPTNQAILGAQQTATITIPAN